MRQTWKAVLASHDVMARDTGGDGMRGSGGDPPRKKGNGAAEATEKEPGKDDG